MTAEIAILNRTAVSLAADSAVTLQVRGQQKIYNGADKLFQLSHVDRQKVLDMVHYMPKSELAVMAESLVSLTSMKRRVSAETETVGGPVDVAVISKGEGFVWIKRKHYFDPSLNPRYFINQDHTLNKGKRNGRDV